MSSDPFSDVLRLTEAKSLVAGGISAGGNWGLKFLPPVQIVLSVIARGSCWLRLDPHKKSLQLEQGDIGLLNGKVGFTLGATPNAPTTSADAAFTTKTGAFLQVGRGADCVVMAVRISLHPSSAALLTDVLPSVIHLRGSSPRAAPIRALLEQLVDEHHSPLPGTGVASERIAELLFIQILRAHLASDASLPPGWLRAVRDERILKALERMHDAPGRDWTVEELAKVAGMSRTRFAVHFRATAGTAPLTYLGEWRMRLAQRSLREDSTSIATLAESLGYTSESAFSTAFKRITGSAPRTYRMAERMERLRK